MLQLLRARAAELEQEIQEFETRRAEVLAVYARYTRRGGLDINPFRTSSAQALPQNTRTARQ